jgi:D-3-phosphoglycerate dehydrogenase
VFKIKTFNSISIHGLNEFGRDKYEVSSDSSAPDAILLRSHKLQIDEISSGVRAVARAGAGTNNTDRGM